MLELAIGGICLTMATSLYIGDKVAETIQIRRHRKAKMSPEVKIPV